MSKPYSRRATVEDGKELARTICEADRLEVEGLGQSPDHIPLYILMSDVATSFFDADGTLAGIAGIGPDGRPGVGVIWMLTTDALANHPHTFVRSAKKWIAEHSKPYTMLWNLADARNHVHRKLLKHLGFSAVRSINIGPQFLPYMEIVKLCA